MPGVQPAGRDGSASATDVELHEAAAPRRSRRSSQKAVQEQEEGLLLWTLPTLLRLAVFLPSPHLTRCHVRQVLEELSARHLLCQRLGRHRH